MPTKTGEGPKCGGIWGPMKVPSRSRPRARHAQAERPQGETLGAVTGGRVFPKGSSELRPHLRLAGQEPQGGLRPLGPLLSRVERAPLGPYLES